MKVLTGDIGGTKTLLRITEIADGNGRVVCEQRYRSDGFANLEPMVLQFLGEFGQTDISAACFAVAGPVHREAGSDHCRTTNLPWVLDSRSLEQHCGIPRVRLINDFEAVGRGIDELGDGDLACLRAGVAEALQPRLVLGAGTGLGVCHLLPTSDGVQVLASEGGHLDFAPTNQVQMEFLRFMQRRHPEHVSYDRIVSGPGLQAIFEYLTQAAADTKVGEILAAEDVPAAIASSAADLPLARRAVELFVEIYGAQAGNLALVTLARGGIYIAGGIAPKMLGELKRGGFEQAFLAKGRLRPVLEAMPIHVVLRPDVGLLGAAAVARRMLP